MVIKSLSPCFSSPLFNYSINLLFHYSIIQLFSYSSILVFHSQTLPLPAPVPAGFCQPFKPKAQHDGTSLLLNPSTRLRQAQPKSSGQRLNLNPSTRLRQAQPKSSGQRLNLLPYFPLCAFTSAGVTADALFPKFFRI
jgi:hypothetical protein